MEINRFYYKELLIKMLIYWLSINSLTNFFQICKFSFLMLWILWYGFFSLYLFPLRWSYLTWGTSWWYSWSTRGPWTNATTRIRTGEREHRFERIRQLLFGTQLTSNVRCLISWGKVLTLNSSLLWTGIMSYKGIKVILLKFGHL